MSVAGAPTPIEQKRKKPPRHKWYAGESFWNLRASHWAEILLTLALLTVGASRLYVYQRQAGIMNTQASIARCQLELSEIQERALVSVGNIEITGEKIGTDDKLAVWAIKGKAKNSGETATKNLTVRYALFMPMKGQIDSAFDGMSSSLDPADLGTPDVKSRIGPKDEVPIGLSTKANGTADGDLGIPSGNAEWIASGFQRAYYYSIVQYHDAFKGTIEHVTKFCFVIKASRASKDAQAVP